MNWITVPIREKLFCGSYCELNRMNYKGGIIRQMYSDRYQSTEYWADTEGDRERASTLSEAMRFLRENEVR